MIPGKERIPTTPSILSVNMSQVFSGWILTVTCFPKMSTEILRASPRRQLVVLFENSAWLNQDMQSELKQMKGGRRVLLLALAVVAFH